MINMIKSDLYRIFRGKAIYIIAALIVLMVTVDVVGMSAGSIGITVGAESSMEDDDVEMLQKIKNAKSLGEYRDVIKSYGAFELDRQIVGLNVNLYYFFIAVVVAVLCADFSNKCVKNTLSSAITRSKYYFSKLILVMGLVTMLIFFNNYLAYFLNLAVNGKSFASDFGEFTKVTFMQLPLLYGITSLLVCLAFALKKTSKFNTIGIPLILVIQMVVMGAANFFKIKADWFYDYEIQFALAKLAGNPTSKYIVSCICLGMAYIIVFNILGYLSFNKSEIK